MPNLSGSKLAELTGFAWRTVKRRLIDAGVQPVGKHGSADLYESRAALLALYAPGRADDAGFDPVQERARKDAEQADKLAMQNAVQRGELARKEDVVRFWSDCCANMKARLLRLPGDCAAAVPPEHRAVVQHAAQLAVHDALARLSESDRG